MKGSLSNVSEHLVLLVLLGFVSGLFVHYDVLWRWDNLLYDAQLSTWERRAAEEVIIVAIDDESLNQEGRWPWPRSKHAALIDKIELESPQAIALDIIFSEPDLNNPLADESLARAMQSSGKVILPLFMTQENRFSYPIEALPLAEYTQQAAALGHVHIDVSEDGIARRVFLKEGIDKPQWPHYSVAVLSITDDEYVPDADSIKKHESHSVMRWSKEDPFLIPYAGPPGHFKQIGYSQVMAGQYPKDLFFNKIVLVGTTAEGLGDSYPTPVSGDEGRMPGVEIIANIIDAIKNDIKIEVLDKNTLIFITVLLVVLPLLFYSMLNPASAFVVLVAIIGLTILVTEMVFVFFGYWIPLSAILLFQFVSYPLWSWRRLALAMRHINQELNKLTVMQRSLRIHRVKNIVNEITFISELLPVTGWVILDEENNVLLQKGEAIKVTKRKLKSQQWLILGSDYWAYAIYDNQRCKLGMRIEHGVYLSKKEKEIINKLIYYPDKRERQGGLTEDVLKSKIIQLQQAGQEYQELRRIVDDSLSGMADGVIICDGTGQIMLSNHRSGWYLFADDNADINGLSILSVFESISLSSGDRWDEIFQKVLLDNDRVHVEAQHKEGRDLMIAISPLKHIANSLVVNLSDLSLLKDSERKRNEALNFLSHDLRSPLASIIALIELAKEKTEINEMRSMLDGMKTNTRKTLHLAEQFLQLSRANTTEKINFYEVDINSVALNAMDQVWGLASKRNVKMNHVFVHEEVWTQGDPDMLERAILNLLSNAIKHSAENSEIKVKVDIVDKLISCCVIDQGSGISEDELPHLFEMFRRTRDSGVKRKLGIGLGLAFVDAVAKRHGGKVEVESELGKGSSFCIFFPQV